MIIIHRKLEREEVNPGTHIVSGGTYEGTEGPRDLPVGEDGIWVEFPVVQLQTDGPYTSEYRMTVCYDALYSMTSFGNRVKHQRTFPIRARRQSAARDMVVGWDETDLSFDTAAFSASFSSKADSKIMQNRFALNRTSLDSRLEELRSLWDPTISLTLGLNISDPLKGRPGQSVIDAELWYPAFRQRNMDSSVQLPQRPTNDSMDNVWTVLGKAYLPFLKFDTFDFINYITWRPFRSLTSDEVSAPRAFSIRSARKEYILSTRTPERQITTLNPTLSSVFYNVLDATNGNIAVAWQALTTAVMSSVYYDWLPKFATNEAVIITQLVQRSQPVRPKGYVIAMAVALAQLLLLFVSMWLFSRCTRWSMIDSAWQAISQLVGPETLPLMTKSTLARDREVSGMPEARGYPPNFDDQQSTSSGLRTEKPRARLVLKRYDEGTVGVTAC